MSLAEQVAAAVASPATDDAFDPGAALADVLAGIGMTPDDGGGRVVFAGADPVVPSTLRLGGAAAVALAAKSVAVAKLHRLRGGEGQDVGVDLRTAPHRLCPFYDRRWELLNGHPAGMPANPSQAFGLRFYPTADGRWVMPLNIYPRIKVAAQRLLGVPDDTRAVAAAVARWQADDLERAGAEAGVVMPVLRTTAELLAEEQFTGHLAGAPLVEVTRIGDSAPEPLPSGAEQPLDGVRALGMGHVIAGAGVGRALALHGADVLNLWRPDELEHDVTYVTANVGVRSATVDPTSVDGAARVRELLAGADVFYANRRPGMLDRVGLGAEEAASVRPGIVHATASLNGPTGPWADRLGFDQTAGSLVGMMHLEGDGTRPGLPPIVVVNDYVVSWLLTAGVVEALSRRAVEGGSWRVHVSLTRAALWILGLGTFEQQYALETAGRGEAHAYLDPETFTAQTPLGHYQGVTEQVRMSRTPGRYRTVLVPRGSCAPQWLPPGPIS
ncbi:MAG: biosynthetic enzyme [Frankiales bacterium]|nr:biosynthetic enzyme [Frankiales bacterium]